MSKSELFGNMPDSMPKNNVMKNDFNWEVPVESIPLPSKGMIYSPESRLYNTETIKIKAMTTKGMPMALLVASSKSKIPKNPKINS